MPRKIGRYEILGPLATGGMAELLLARLVGPSGFERPVVIKRIRRDLDHKELVSLFLEEARIAAKVRHANVVTVEDLGTDDGVPYLVMEYLEGESLSNVTRRLVMRGERMPFGLAAFVVAEACAGLHAAHELRDANGKSYELVHRDVSPQNLFVKYDGAIKVLDFGVAVTNANADDDSIRGKTGYMSPEQLEGKTLDRRADVFALGIVLYELVSSHRLFKRFNRAATRRAVLVERIVPPSRIEPSVPRALERICMRALSRNVDERYATAAEMRRELLVAMRDLASEEPAAELADVMARSFADRIEEKNVLLRNVREGSLVDRIPEGDVDVTVEIPAIEEMPDSQVGAPPPPSETPPATVPRHSASSPVALTRSPMRAALALASVAVISVTATVVVRAKLATRAVPPTTESATPSAATTSSSPASAAGIAAPPPVPDESTNVPTTAASATRAPTNAPRRPRAPLVASASTTVVVEPPPPTEPPKTAPSASARGYRRFQ